MTGSARSGFGPDTTADEVIAGVDLTGKLALVTGGSGGLGAESGRAFASAGARVILTARFPSGPLAPPGSRWRR